VGEFLVPVEEELDTPQALLFGLELEAPFDNLMRRFAARSAGAVAVPVGIRGRSNISNLCWDLVARNAISTWPAEESNWRLFLRESRR
jgi:hypothetical protein